MMEQLGQTCGLLMTKFMKAGTLRTGRLISRLTTSTGIRATRQDLAALVKFVSTVW
jgi:hypothetical protein